MKGAFLTPLITEDLNDGAHKRLHADLVYRAADGTIYTVKAGFVTDLFSIPPVIRALLPKDQKGNAAAVIHDAAYSGDIVPFVEHRGTADSLLNEGMEALDVRRSRRAVIYSGVRLGGWHAWRKEHPKAPPCSEATAR